MRKHYTPTFKAQMVQELLKEDQTIAQIASEHGVHPTQLNKWKAAALQGLPSLFADDRQGAQAIQAAHEQQVQALYAEIGRLTTQVAWLKKNLALNLTLPERLALVEHGHPGVSLTLQADLLGVSRSSLYYQPVLPSAEEVALKHRIDEIYTASPFYGSRRITAVLNRAMTINRKKVQRCMREMGIAGICPGPNLSQRHADHPIYPYLLRNLTVRYPNHVWGIEIV